MYYSVVRCLLVFYLAMHRTLSGVTPLRIWEVLATSGRVDMDAGWMLEMLEMLREHANLLPEEHFAEAVRMGEGFLERFQELQRALTADLEATRRLELSDKVLALGIKRPEHAEFQFELPPKARPLLFVARKNQPVAQALWRMLRPSN